VVDARQQIVQQKVRELSEARPIRRADRPESHYPKVIFGPKNPLTAIAFSMNDSRQI
jgi:hypothetical protein